MSTQDPFDRVRKSNPVDPHDLPGAPLGMADRVVAEGSPRRFRISGPVLGLASMAFVLVVGGVTTAIIVSGSEGSPGSPGLNHDHLDHAANDECYPRGIDRHDRGDRPAAGD